MICTKEEMTMLEDVERMVYLSTKLKVEHNLWSV